MPLDDEMPLAPDAGTPTTNVVTFSGEFDAEILDKVPGLGDALPAGVYHARLRSFQEKSNDKGPYFSLFWVIQQEPFVGRPAFENYVPWVSKETMELAAAGNPQAQAEISEKLPRIKAIMKAAEYKPVGKSDIKQFLSSNPEVKLQLNVKEKKQKDSSGAYVGTGEMENGVVKYLSLQAPR